MSDANNGVVRLLREIVLGGQTSKETAAQLEGAILEQFPDADEDERFEELLHVLASYEPSGGDYLYDASALVAECRSVLSLFKS